MKPCNIIKQQALAGRVTTVAKALENTGYSTGFKA